MRGALLNQGRPSFFCFWGKRGLPSCLFPEGGAECLMAPRDWMTNAHNFKDAQMHPPLPRLCCNWWGLLHALPHFPHPSCPLGLANTFVPLRDSPFIRRRNGGRHNVPSSLCVSVCLPISFPRGRGESCHETRKAKGGILYPYRDLGKQRKLDGHQTGEHSREIWMDPSDTQEFTWVFLSFV